MQIAKEKKLEKVLDAMSEIMTDTSRFTVKYEVRKFLQCSYDIFSLWKAKLNSIALGTSDENKFWDYFEDFLNECGNGSWSGMSRHKSEIYIQKSFLYTLVQKLLSAENNLDKIVGIIRNITNESSLNKINGLTPFPLTGMLFASNEENFMVLDNPVIKYFSLKGYDDALQDYGNIIEKSREYSERFNISMWFVNKGYGIVSHQNRLGLKKLCGTCVSPKGRNYEYQF